MRKDAHSARVLSGRYELGDRLGAGGFGAVYQAEDRELQRTVAIKLFDPKQTGRGGELEERFRREAIATAAIRHPNVVTVFDVGTEGASIYIVMELLSGRPLTKELERWPHGMPATRALPLLVGALEGLAAGHEAGIVHKDLKPSNLFLARPGEPGEKLAVIDFGVARVLHDQKLTATGKLVGTPRYLAPEYIQDLVVTTALDVYQMGLIAVELLCGMPCLPRKLDLVSCCQRHVDGDLDIPDGLRSGQIGEVLARATAVDPKARFQTAKEFSDALRAVNPEDVKITTAGGHVPTPRIGIKPLTKPDVDTQKLHGGRAAMNAARSSTLDVQEAKQRSTRTGPTKRLGPAKEIAAQLESVAVEEPVKAPRARATVPIDATIAINDPTDPLAGRRRAIYVLLFLALVMASGTIAFFAMNLGRRSMADHGAANATPEVAVEPTPVEEVEQVEEVEEVEESEENEESEEVEKSEKSEPVVEEPVEKVERTKPKKPAEKDEGMWLLD